jgi:hypothetical protein
MNADGTQKQFDFAKDAVSQLITICSGILAISLTFSKDWATTASGRDKVFLQLAWISFLLSILGGLASLLAIAGLTRLGGKSIKDPALRVPWLVQAVAFIAGLALFSIFGFRVLS